MVRVRQTTYDSAAVFTPVRQARASGEIVSQIERAIFGGELSAGDRLQSERELAEQFSVSRITVRDALRVLEARGLVRVKVGATGGAFVSEANVDRVAESLSTMIRLKRMTLSEIAEARTVVEAAVVELAARRADIAALARIAASVDRGRAVIRDESSHLGAAMDFHVAVAQATGNEVLYATVRAYHELIVSGIGDMHDARSARLSQKAHEDILEALRARDPQGAREALLEHLADFEKRLRRWLQQSAKDREGARTKPVALTRRAPRRSS